MTDFITEQDRDYAKGLLADLAKNDPREHINIAAQWFLKARVESAARREGEVK